MRFVGISMAIVVGGCATVTRASSLETEPARAWLAETGEQRVSVDSPGDARATGRIVEATPRGVLLQDEDGRPIQLAVRNGTTLREPKRGRGAALGAFAGLALGVIAGLILDKATVAANPDGDEHLPMAVPIGMLGGALIGAVVGAIVGSERRLEVNQSPGP